MGGKILFNINNLTIDINLQKKKIIVVETSVLFSLTLQVEYFYLSDTFELL